MKYYLLIVGIIVALKSTAQTEVTSFPDVIYPKYRTWTTPTAGEIAEINPPSFQWPVTDDTTYSLQVSKNSDFSEILIEKESIPFAIYNPHQKLESGTWYWRYADKDKEWKNLDSFQITSNSKVFCSPPIEELYKEIPSSHPRVLAKKLEIDIIRESATNKDEARAIIEEANSYLGSRIPKEEEALSPTKGKNAKEDAKLDQNASKNLGWDIHKRLLLFSQAYILTGSEKYFASALGLMLEVSSWDPKGPTYKSNFGDAGIMSGLAIAFDTFYHLMDEAERATVMNHSAARANGFYDIWINKIERRSSSMHVWQHIMHQVLQTSLALFGEHKDANKWLEYIYEIWLAQNPKMGEADGAWINGTGYYAMNTLTIFDVSRIFSELTKVNFLDNDFLRNNPKWLIYAFPPGNTADGFGNDGDKPYPTLRYAGYADAAAQLLDNPYAAWYARKITANLEIDISKDEEFRWFRITKHLPSGSLNLLPSLDLPQAEIFRDVGVAYMHTSIQDPKNDLMLSARSSPFGSLAHTHAEQNSFNISYKGKRLFYNTGYRAAMMDPHFKGWYKHTQGHNAVLIDGEGQPFNAGAYGWMPRFLNNDEISYAVGDASQAYSGTDLKDTTDLGLTKFRRHYIMLRPSTIIIYDELEADHDATWTWLLHNDTGMKVDAVRYQILAGNEEGEAKVNLFTSSDIDFQVTDQFSIPVENWTSKKDHSGQIIDFKDQWHFKGVSKKKLAKMRFLAIFQILPNGDFSEVKYELSNGTFNLPNWKITAELDTSRAANITVVKKDQTVGLVSNGMLTIGGKTFGKPGENISRLVDFKNGDDLIKESSDFIPKSIQKVMDMESKSKE